MKIFFLVPYPLKVSPSQRFRFEQYFEILSASGYAYRVQSFLESHNWHLFFKSGNTLKKGAALAQGFLKRCAAMFMLLDSDFVFIHREVTPVGPPLFEWIIAKVLRKKIIYDFDDAIWLTDRKQESFILRLVKWRRKVSSICRWSYRVSCGNKYLCAFASLYNNNVTVNPTTIDTENVHNPDFFQKEANDRLVIGWTGSHSTLKYLHEIEDVLQDVEKRFPVRFMIIADQPSNLRLHNIQFVPWNTQTEIEDLFRFDIGIMPLPDDDWSKGKCGFKALQYMAMKIPTVASPVGVNTSIITDYETGLLASTPDEWRERLTALILDKELRHRLGLKGRNAVVKNYSVLSNASNFLSLFV